MYLNKRGSPPLTDWLTFEDLDRLAEEYEEASLWVLEDNPRARRFYEAAGWRLHGTPKLVVYLDVDVASVRYTKRLGTLR